MIVTPILFFFVAVVKKNPVSAPEKRQQLRHDERNHILTEIHNLIRVEETSKVDAVSNIENTPHDSRRMFQAIKDI